MQTGAIRFNMVYFLSDSHHQHMSVSGTSGTDIGGKTRKIKKIATTGIISHESPLSRSLPRSFSAHTNPAILHARYTEEAIC